MELCESGNAKGVFISNSQTGKMIMRTCGLANIVAFNLNSPLFMFMPSKTSMFVMNYKMAVKAICEDYLIEHSELLTAHCD